MLSLLQGTQHYFCILASFFFFFFNSMYHYFLSRIFVFLDLDFIAYDWDNGNRWRRRVREGDRLDWLSCYTTSVKKKKSRLWRVVIFISISSHERNVERESRLRHKRDISRGLLSHTLCFHADKAVIVLRPFKKGANMDFFLSFILFFFFLQHSFLALSACS